MQRLFLFRGRFLTGKSRIRNSVEAERPPRREPLGGFCPRRIRGRWLSADADTRRILVHFEGAERAWNFRCLDLFFFTSFLPIED